MANPLPPRRRFTFGRAMRLSGARRFDAVFAGGVRRQAGPMAVLGLPNGLPYCRLGLSVGRRVGGAVKRNRIKRLLREAFRLSQHELPAGYDLVLAVRPHEPLTPEAYRALLLEAAEAIDRKWARRRAADAPPPPADGETGGAAGPGDRVD